MKNNTKQTLKIFWGHVKRYKISSTVVLLSMIAVSITNTVTPLYYKKFFDVLTENVLEKSTLVPKLINILLFIFFLEIIHWLFWRIATFFSSYFQTRAIADIANTCFRYLHLHSYSYFNNTFVGSLVKKVNRFTWEIIPLIFNIGIIIVVLFWKNKILGFAMCIWLIIFLSFNWVLTKYKLKFDIKRSQAETDASRVLADTITNQINLKLFNGYKREVKLFTDKNSVVQKLRQFTWNLDNTFEAIQGFLMIILEIGMFYMAVNLWTKDLFTVGDFVLLQTYVLIVMMKIWDFGRMVRHIYQNMADAEEMTEILLTPHEIVDIPNAKALRVNKGEIEFKNISFYYHQTNPVLKDFNLKIKSKEKIALVGPSGAGKTTITRLILRLHDIQAGKIFVDNQDISKIKLASLWKNISLVPQDPILFHRTLSENIAYGKPGATQAEIESAAKKAHAHEFIKEFEEGYDTYVGERGIKLSGGERQRVAIARSILHDAPILILDEATSSLDSKSELLIQDALDNLMKNKTVIVVAHRLSTIIKSDRILVIDKQGILEEGSHQELLKKPDGLYNKLWSLQAGGFIK